MRTFKHESGEIMIVLDGQSVLQVLIDSPSWTEIQEVTEDPEEKTEEAEPPKRAAKLKK